MWPLCLNMGVSLNGHDLYDYDIIHWNSKYYLVDLYVEKQDDYDLYLVELNISINRNPIEPIGFYHSYTHSHDLKPTLEELFPNAKVIGNIAFKEYLK